MERRVRATTELRAPFVAARHLVVDDPGRVIADHPTMAERAERRFAGAIGVEIGEGAAVRQEILVELGPPVVAGAELTLPVSWEARGRTSLFPVFTGDLVLEAHDPGSRLILTGTYQVPLGPLGRFGDALVGRRVAQRSITAFVQLVASRIDAEIDRRRRATGWRPASYPVDLHEHGRISTERTSTSKTRTGR